MIILTNKIYSFVAFLLSTAILFTGCSSKRNTEDIPPQIELPSVLPTPELRIPQSTNSEEKTLPVEYSEQDDKSDIETSTIEEEKENLNEDTTIQEEEVTTNVNSSIPITEVSTEPIIATQKTQVEEERPFWQSESSRQINNLISIASATQADYVKNGSFRGWYSNNGKLYDYYNDRYVTTDDLVYDAYLESGLLATDYDLLLIDGTHLSYFSGVTVPEEAMRFGAFASTKTANGYLICSPYGKIGTLSEENYVALLSLYNSDHGKVYRLSSASIEYNRILNYVRLFEGMFDDYFVREISLDEKYGVVIFSNVQDSSKIKQYIIRNSNNIWEVVFPDCQDLIHPITVVNQYLPDFNLELLPSYTLGLWQNNLSNVQDDAVNALIELGEIKSQDDIYYLCATNTCAYIVLHNGNSYCAYAENNIWNIKLVTSDFEASNFFQSYTGIDYGFLILDD